MKYIALLRGINVGGNHKVEMKKIKELFESLSFSSVSTYINSGNILFEGAGKPQEIRQKLESNLKKAFGFDIPTLVKTEKEMIRIAEAVPRTWKNDAEQRTDVAYLFPEIDAKKIIDELPVKKEFIDVRYIKGAIFWNVKREDVYKSHLAKIISHKIYQFMTVRNVNTARYLAGDVLSK